MRIWTIAAVLDCLLLSVSGAADLPDPGVRDAATDRESLDPPLYTAWVPFEQRSPLQNLDIRFKDHDGRPGMLRDLTNKPSVITFFYTRCQNGRKCSMAVGRLGALQRQLAQAGIADKVRLIAISYEPQFDTPERINRYATDRGLSLGENALALQLESNQQQQLADELQAPVNFNAGWVNTHGVELSLLDAKGRLVRQYHTLLWDNDQVAEDLRRVMTEK
jgi:cytochrome oxidase Cu insertion factor (SCO1/SenC/PrrC family)